MNPSSYIVIAIEDDISVWLKSFLGHVSLGQVSQKSTKKVGFPSHLWKKHKDRHLGIYSLSGRKYDPQIWWNPEAARLDVDIFLLFFDLAGASSLKQKRLKN